MPGPFDRVIDGELREKLRERYKRFKNPVEADMKFRREHQKVIVSQLAGLTNKVCEECVRRARHYIMDFTPEEEGGKLMFYVRINRPGKESYPGVMYDCLAIRAGVRDAVAKAQVELPAEKERDLLAYASYEALVVCVYDSLSHFFLTSDDINDFIYGRLLRLDVSVVLDNKELKKVDKCYYSGKRLLVLYNKRVKGLLTGEEECVFGETEKALCALYDNQPKELLTGEGESMLEKMRAKMRYESLYQLKLSSGLDSDVQIARVSGRGRPKSLYQLKLSSGLDSDVQIVRVSGRGQLNHQSGDNEDGSKLLHNRMRDPLSFVDVLPLVLPEANLPEQTIEIKDIDETPQVSVPSKKWDEADLSSESADAAQGESRVCAYSGDDGCLSGNGDVVREDGCGEMSPVLFAPSTEAAHVISAVATQV